MDTIKPNLCYISRSRGEQLSLLTFSLHCIFCYLSLGWAGAILNIIIPVWLYTTIWSHLVIRMSYDWFKPRQPVCSATDMWWAQFCAQRHFPPLLSDHCISPSGELLFRALSEHSLKCLLSRPRQPYILVGMFASSISISQGCFPSFCEWKSTSQPKQ